MSAVLSASAQEQSEGGTRQHTACVGWRTAVKGADAQGMGVASLNLLSEIAII